MKTCTILTTNTIEFNNSSIKIDSSDGYLIFTDGYNPSGIALSEIAAPSSYIYSFVDYNVVDGYLTITHGLNNKYVIVEIYNNSDKKILPDDVTLVDANSCIVDLTTYGTLTGTWHAIVSVGSMSSLNTVSEYFSAPTLASDGAITVTKYSNTTAFTVGTRFAVNSSSRGIISGVRFYCGGTVTYPRIFTFKLWDSVGSAITSVNANITTNGLYEISFPALYSVAVSDRLKTFTVSYYDTSTPGTIEYPFVATDAFPNRPALPFYKSENVILIADNYWATGNAYPNSTSGTERYLIEPIVL